MLSLICAFPLLAIVTVRVSSLAARWWAEVAIVRERARVVEKLLAFTRTLARARTLNEVLRATAYEIASTLRVRIVLLLPENGAIVLRTRQLPEDMLQEVDFAAAKWAWENDRPAGRDSDAYSGATWLFLPMRTGRGNVGVLGIRRNGPGVLLRAEQRWLLDTQIDQCALAIERVQLVDGIDQVKRMAERDSLPSTLLTSISHDLKTPLTAVLGAAGALRDLPSSFDENAKADLLATIIDESERLNRFIANLFDMTKLESGAVVPGAAPHDVGEIVGTTLQRSRKILANHRVDIVIAPDLLMVMVDAVLFEQVLFNLLDNAAKYAAPNSTIQIRSWRDGRNIKLEVMDEGDGIPVRDLERIFDKFYRAHNVRAGTGLGLAISRGFVEALHGTITAANRMDRPGAVFTIALPTLENVAAKPPERPLDEGSGGRLQSAPYDGNEE